MRSTRRQLLPFSALSATYFAHIGFFNPYLPLWLQELGYSLMTLSLLMTVPSATRLLGPYAWGWLSDHTGERVKLLRYSATAALLISAGLWVQGGTAWLALVLFLVFLHTSAMMPMSEAALAHLVTRDGSFDARRYGRVRLWGSLGFLLTVFAAGAWFEAWGLGHFPAWTVASLALVTASAWCLPDLKDAHAPHEPKPSLRPVLRERTVQWFFAAAIFHVLAHMGLYIYFSLHLDALGYSKTVIGLMWAVSVIVEIIWFYTQGRWLPRLPLTGWLLLCALLAALRMAITAQWAALWFMLLLAQCLHAFTFAAHHATCIAWLSQHFPGRLRGRGQALYAVLAYGAPGVLGGLTGGVISSRLGLPAVFWACAGCALLSAFCAWRLVRASAGLPPRTDAG
ncbi:MAG: MFS transporter [Curvibacter sp.]|nr:MFS transporter [Curvibacter sp.]